jgi:K+-sensing histidine kinase KdpD
VPEDQLSEIGRRGRRLDERVPGEGLGIAIATDIAETAGGALELRNSRKGFMVTLNLQAPGRVSR